MFQDLRGDLCLASNPNNVRIGEMFDELVFGERAGHLHDGKLGALKERLGGVVNALKENNLDLTGWKGG